MSRSKRRVHNRRKSHTHKRRSHKRRSHKRRSHKRRSYRRKQRGGFNKNSSGNTTYFTMDHRYRPFGGVTDSVMYHGKSLVGGIEGKYKPVNPSTSNQPIGQALSVKDLRFASTKV
tara:strand:- start:4948 stop:5295 length:348 start_codon:yes stop_codon:yes gene_type:complete